MGFDCTCKERLSEYMPLETTAIYANEHTIRMMADTCGSAFDRETERVLKAQGVRGYMWERVIMADDLIPNDEFLYASATTVLKALKPICWPCDGRSIPAGVHVRSVTWGHSTPTFLRGQDSSETSPEVRAEVGLTFALAYKWTLEGRRVRRAGWGERSQWIRRVDLCGGDKEFRVTESPEAVGTWMPFLVIKTGQNQLWPWVPSAADLSADDWELA